ncbi:MAG: LysR family transcriptional regulator [Deltaproteobacteria bacterium]|nr:LysR family transcriptional regulator [Nannocystaceae bacterium]
MPIRHATVRQLQVFEAAARLRSFSRAGVELHLTQPGVSMQIKQLEEHAGLPLFDRIGRTPSLTEAGRLLLRHAHDVLRAFHDADDTLAALQGLRAGHIDIAVTSTAKYFAPRLLARFRDLHPMVEIRLAVDNREDVIQALASNAVDLAIMGRAPHGLDTSAVPFADHPLVVIAAPDHPLASRKRITVESVANESFIVREPGSGTRLAMEGFFADAHVVPRIGMQMASNETIKQAVMAGMGVSFISRHTIGLELSSGRLAVLAVRGLPVMRQWHVVHLAHKRLSPAAAAFREYVLAHGRAVIRDYADAR